MSPKLQYRAFPIVWWTLTATLLILASVPTSVLSAAQIVVTRPAGPAPNPTVVGTPSVATLHAVVLDENGEEEYVSPVATVTWEWWVTKDDGAEAIEPNYPANEVALTDAGHWPDNEAVFQTLTATFSEIGAYHIRVRCSITDESWTEDPLDGEDEFDISVRDIAVTFSKSEVRPGIGANRTETVTATARRAAGGAAVTIDLSTEAGKATVAPASFQIAANQTTGTGNLTITGTAASVSEDDEHVVAKVGGDEKGRMDVTVLVPKKWTSDNKPGTKTDNNPSVVQDGNAWKVHWIVNIQYTVQDQFGATLKPHWAGVLIWEHIVNSQQPWSGFVPGSAGTAIDASAQAIDPVQYLTGPLTQQDANLVANGQANFGPINAGPATLEYKVTDGAQTYPLDGTVARTIHIQNDTMTVTDQ